jgi:hypothetical protein
VGEIYKHCPDSQTKQALRHVCHATYASPAINHQLDTLRLELKGADAEQAADELVAACSPFPKHATIRRMVLRFKGATDDDTRAGSILWLACAEGFRTRLSSVRELEIRLVGYKVRLEGFAGGVNLLKSSEAANCIGLTIDRLQDYPFMDEKEATRLAGGVKLLCPGLERLVCGGREACGWSVFFGILASSALPLQDLSFWCYPGAWDQVVCDAVAEIVREVGRMKGLRGLLQLSVTPDDHTDVGDLFLDVGPLSSLCRLQKLDLEFHCDVQGVQAVLSSYQQLTSLKLDVALSVKQGPCSLPP